MAVTSGFFNSLSSDRLYNASDFSRLFNGLIRDGVFATIGDYLMVKPHSGMDILVGSGRAWFNSTWTNNDADYILTIDAAEVALNRIDVVVLEINLRTEVRENSFKVIKGVAGVTPVAPTLTNTETVKQYPLAHIYVGAGVTSIILANITNKIGTTTTPFVTAILVTLDITDLVAQWNSEFDIWLATQAQEFDTWFLGLQADLDGEIATNLQNQIYAIEADNWVTTPRINAGAITPAKLSAALWPVSAAGDMLYASAADTLARLQKGSPKQFLKMNAGGTAPEWVTKEDDTTVYLVVFDVTEGLKVGDGAKYFTIPSVLNGAILIGARASIYTPSSSGAISIQIARGRRSSPTSSPSYNDVLTTKITIDQSEFDSSDAVAPVIGTTYRDVLTKDVIRVDVDGAGTGAKGLDVGLVFRL